MNDCDQTAELTELEKEQRRREYFETIVAKAIMSLDRIRDNHFQNPIAVGTVDAPSEEVQSAVNELCRENEVLREENAHLRRMVRHADPIWDSRNSDEPKLSPS